MAARTRSKATEEAFDAQAKPAAKKSARATAKSAAPDPAASKAPARKAAAKKAPGARKPAAVAKPKGKTPAAEKTASRASKAAGDERQMLVEQNEALRAELEAAKTRIAQLEKVHGDVLDRIDWVIDSLQTALEDKA